MKNLFFLMMVFILSSCASSDKMDVGYKNLLIIRGIDLSKVSSKNIEEQKKFNQNSLSSLPKELVARFSSKCIENFHLIRYMRTDVTTPIPNFTIEFTFMDGRVEKHKFMEGEVTYQELSFSSHELFGERVDVIIENLHKAFIGAQCFFVKKNSNKIPHTIEEDQLKE